MVSARTQLSRPLSPEMFFSSRSMPFVCTTKQPLMNRYSDHLLQDGNDTGVLTRALCPSASHEHEWQIIIFPVWNLPGLLLMNGTPLQLPGTPWHWKRHWGRATAVKPMRSGILNREATALPWCGSMLATAGMEIAGDKATLEHVVYW